MYFCNQRLEELYELRHLFTAFICDNSKRSLKAEPECNAGARLNAYLHAYTIKGSPEKEHNRNPEFVTRSRDFLGNNLCPLLSMYRIHLVDCIRIPKFMACPKLNGQVSTHFQEISAAQSRSRSMVFFSLCVRSSMFAFTGMYAYSLKYSSHIHKCML